MLDFQSFTRNPVCTVRYCGFESDTLTLQQAGWLVAAQQDSSRMTVRLCLKHKVGEMYALTNDVEYYQIAGWLRARGSAPLARDHRGLVFDVVLMSSNVRVAHTVMHNSVPWRAVDCFPSAVSACAEERDLRDLVPFLPVNHNAEQIIIAPESVPQVLDLLLKCQGPAAAERRERDRRREMREASKITAQVLVA